MKILPKDKSIRLAKGLTTLEFACQCKNSFCLMTLVHPSLAKAFGKFRNLINVPMKINSGYRCPAHNLEEGGKPCSFHQAGMAIDISLKSLSHLSRSDIEFAAKESGFTYVKFYKSFVHLDVR